MYLFCAVIHENLLFFSEIKKGSKYVIEPGGWDAPCPYYPRRICKKDGVINIVGVNGVPII